MHIVGENNEDMTAKLALAPQRFKQKAQSHDKLARHILEHDLRFHQQPSRICTSTGANSCVSRHPACYS